MSKAQFLKENMKPGESYAGLILGQNGEADYHLFIIPGEAEKVTWAKAKEWAKKAGGDLPTRREQRVLFANAKQEFKPEWYPARCCDCRQAGSAETGRREIGRDNQTLHGWRKKRLLDALRSGAKGSKGAWT
jgi:hypothetical protein